MYKFVLLGSDHCHRKGGLSNSPLSQFLKIFYSDQELRILTSAQLDHHRPISTEFLLVETPSSHRRDQLGGIRYQKAVLFDESDCWWFNETQEQQDFLGSLTDLVLKTHVDRSHNHSFHLGTLPTYRKKKLQQYLRWKAMKEAVIGRRSKRNIDLFFIGAPTRLQTSTEGSSRDYNQRLEWLSEVMAENFPFRFEGGFDGTNRELIQTFEQDDGDLSPYLASRRYNFYSYFNQLSRSKVAMVPTGFARWTYRHYEAVYAKSVMLSTDMTNVELFVPLTPHIINVSDHVPLLPYIEQGIHMFDEQSDLLEENVKFIEQYYDNGRFSKRRPKALERFLLQLEPGYDTRQVVSDF